MPKIMHLDKEFAGGGSSPAYTAGDGIIISDNTISVNNENIYGTSDKWSSAKSYAVGDSVIYNNQVWSCILANDNQTPADGSLYWSKINLSNLGGMSFRVNDGKPEWKVAGADTWSPFSGGKNNIVLSYNTQYVIDTGLTQINGFHIYTPRKVNSNWVLSVSYFGGSTQMVVAASDDGSAPVSERTMPCTAFAGNLAPLINKIEGGKITITGNTYNSNFDSEFYWEAW